MVGTSDWSLTLNLRCCYLITLIANEKNDDTLNRFASAAHRLANRFIRSAADRTKALENAKNKFETEISNLDKILLERIDKEILKKSSTKALQDKLIFERPTFRHSAYCANSDPIRNRALSSGPKQGRQRAAQGLPTGN